jgi:RHS repeat-associated protein
VNEITSIASSTLYVANDKNGNMIKVSKPDNWSAAYTLMYDAWNRLVQVKDGATTVATYFYDGANRRVKKTVGSETRLFYFNKDWQCVEEYVGSTCDVRFVWGLRYVDDLVTYRKSLTDYYVLQDANWNVIALANTSGVVLERYTYSSFGKQNLFDASFVPKSASTFNLTRSFTGQVLDNETGLMLYRNRVYHPILGRFLQRDLIGYYGDDTSLYRYVLNLPVKYIDPIGLDWADDRMICDYMIGNPNCLTRPISNRHKVTCISPFTTFEDSLVWKWWNWEKNVYILKPESNVNANPNSINNSIANILAGVNKKVGCVETLNISGHGSASGGVAYYKSARTESFDSSMPNCVAEAIANELCNNATVNICACKGAILPKQHQQLADMLQARVCACTGLVHSACTCEGNWICLEPLTVDQNIKNARSR